MTTLNDLPEHERVAVRTIVKIRTLFQAELQDLPEALETQVVHNSAAMCVIAGENTPKLVAWATSRILPSHLLYSMTQEFIEITRKECEKAWFPPRISDVLQQIGTPPSKETLDLILDGDVSPKQATVHLIRNLWGRTIDRTNLDTAFSKKRTWDQNELRDLMQCMMRGSQMVRQEAGGSELSWTAKRWGVLIGAYLFRTARGDFDQQNQEQEENRDEKPSPSQSGKKNDFHQDLSEKLYPPAQKLVWLRDLWLKLGEDGFPQMVIIEPALSGISREQVRQLAREGADKLTHEEREMAADLSLRKMLASVGIEISAQKLRNARRSQDPFFETEDMEESERDD